MMNHSAGVATARASVAIRRTTIVFSVAWLLAAPACVISPQPEPPSIDAERITAELSDDSVHLIGGPGAVSVGGVRLSLVNLSDAQLREVVDVDEEGAFEAVLGGAPGDEVRLQVLDGDGDSAAVHVVVPDSDGPVGVEGGALGECLRLDPAGTVDFGGVPFGDVAAAAVTVLNDCEDEVSLGWAYLAIHEEVARECDEVETSCFDGLLPETEGCAADFDACRGVCDGDYDRCILDGLPPEDCLDIYLDCSFVCVESEGACVAETCDEVTASCFDDRFDVHESFGLNAPPDLPLDMAPGDRRSFVVTFSPLEAVEAEELLVLQVIAPVSETRSLRLSGFGVD